MLYVRCILYLEVTHSSVSSVPPIEVSWFPFYHCCLKMIGEGTYFVVYFNTYSQVSTCVSSINVGVSIALAVKVRI